MAETEGSKPKEPRAGPIRTWIRQDPWVAITGGLGLVLYGVLRLAYSMFYANLGLRPEDVGFGYAEILSQSLAGLVVMLLLFLGMSLIPVFFYGLLFTGLLDTSVKYAGANKSVKPGGPEDKWTWRAALIAVAFVGFLALVLWIILFAPDVIRQWTGIGIALIVGAVFVSRGLLFTVRTGWKDFAIRYRRWVFGALVVSVSLVLSTYFLAPHLDGAAVRRGQAVSATLEGWCLSRA